MIPNNEVNTAFEILLEEIEQVISNLNEEGAAAIQERDYEKARRAIEVAKLIEEFREKVKALQKEWAPLTKRRTQREAATGGTRLARGLRTPEEEFRWPILEALHELGGKAPASDVLDRVEKKMKDILNEYDREPLPSTPSSPRWRNTAQWCRSTLVREGLLKNNSPHGIWELSDEGLQALQNREPHKADPNQPI